MIPSTTSLDCSGQAVAGIVQRVEHNTTRDDTRAYNHTPQYTKPARTVTLAEIHEITIRTQGTQRAGVPSAAR